MTRSALDGYTTFKVPSRSTTRTCSTTRGHCPSFPELRFKLGSEGPQLASASVPESTSSSLFSEALLLSSAILYK